MPTVERYAVTLPGVPGTHRPPDVVVVHLTHRLGPDGRPVYADESGGFLVQISETGIAEPLTEQPGPADPMRCLHAHPLPSRQDAGPVPVW